MTQTITARLSVPDLAAPPTAVGISASTSHVGADLFEPALKNWTPAAASADADLLPELGALQPRARDLERNNGYASGAIQTLRDNIIGSTLKLSAAPNYRLLGWSVDEADQWEERTEAEFATWAETTECDATGQQTLWGLAHLAVSSAFLNGDVFALPIVKPRAGSRWGTRIKLIEADRVRTPSHLEYDPSVRRGVRIDSDGEPIGYYIRKTHPGDMRLGGYGYSDAADDHTYVTARTEYGRRRVIHLYDHTREGQSRGRPIITSVMREFKVLDRYGKAHLDTAVAGALVAAFIESAVDGAEVVEAFGGKNAAAQWNDQMASYSTPLRAGATIPLPFGARVKSHTPSAPNNGYDVFERAVLRHVAVGHNLPYELLAKDFSQTNYSSARASLMEAWRYFTGRRRWFSEGFLAPCYEAWMEEAVVSGRVQADRWADMHSAYTRARWIMAGRGWVDPWRESRASEQRMQSGISTLEDENAEQGRDWRETLDQRGKEIRAMIERDIPRPGYLQDENAKNVDNI